MKNIVVRCVWLFVFLFVLYVPSTVVGMSGHKQQPTPNKLLLDAARNNNVPGLQKAIRMRVSLDAQSGGGYTALHWAAHNGNAYAVALLLVRGANPKARNKHWTTPLHLAAAKGDELSARMLLQYGASSNAQKRSGDTPLHMAAREGHEHLAWLFIFGGGGANPVIENRAGETLVDLLPEESETRRVFARAIQLMFPNEAR